MMKSNWIRIEKLKIECPICGHKGWCLISADKSSVICARTESPKRVGNKGAGWLHIIGQQDINYAKQYARPAEKQRTKPPTNWQKLSDECELKITDLSIVSKSLLISEKSLRAMNIGWYDQYRAYTFPMRDGQNNIIGIRTRAMDGKKLTVAGGHNGLFVPNNLSDQGDILLVCEGPTDTAVVLDLGYDVVGRPSNSGGADFLKQFISLRNPRTVIFIPDRDSNESAERLTMASVIELASQIRAKTKIIRPPQKDIRQWLIAGLTRSFFSTVIKNARTL